VKNSLSQGTLKLHISIGVFVVYIDNGNPVPNMPLRSHGLADENKKTFDRMEMIRKKRIKQAVFYYYRVKFLGEGIRHALRCPFLILCLLLFFFFILSNSRS
jgi:hypothetical protein